MLLKNSKCNVVHNVFGHKSRIQCTRTLQYTDDGTGHEQIVS